MMTYPILRDVVSKNEIAESFITKLQLSISNGLPHSTPLSSLQRDEHELVRGVLQMLQGFSGSLFYWDEKLLSFHVKDGIYASHLSQTSLKGLLNPFLFAGTCLKRVEIFVSKVALTSQRVPTLSAFANSINSWLMRLRSITLKEEEQLFASDNKKTTTLLGLTNSLSSMCAGAEHLCHIVNGAVPNIFLNTGTSTKVPACEVSVHILDYLSKNLTEVCLLHGGEGDMYHMLLFVFTETLLPYLQCLDSWLYDGILDDPYQEMFFYANGSVTIDQSAFWENSYLLRTTKLKSVLPVVRPTSSAGTESNISNANPRDSVPLMSSARDSNNQNGTDSVTCPTFLYGTARAILSAGKSLQLVQHVQDQCFENRARVGHEFFDIGTMNGARIMGFLTLSEVFLISLLGLLDEGDHIFEKFKNYKAEEIQNLLNEFSEDMKNGKTWLRFMQDAIIGRLRAGPTKTEDTCHNMIGLGNPVVTLCRELLPGDQPSWSELNVSGSFCLPPLNDRSLREAVFGGGGGTDFDAGKCDGTDYCFGFHFDDLKGLRLEDDKRALETLFPFPTILPNFERDMALSQILPFQKDSTLASRILKFIQNFKLKSSLEPSVIIQECLTTYIKRQVDHVGKNILLKLMEEWKLMDELFVLRSIYLLGSGDLLQQFLEVIYERLDRGDSLDDDFELNTILQDSIRNSADRTILSAPDSFIVSITQENTGDDLENNLNKQKVNSQGFGIDAFDKLNFMYKVSWPLDLIVNTEALKKYNQVMGFLLKVKRAKFVLDKTRRWRWKARGNMENNYKRHLLIEQKLLQFVDAFHQYVMDRVYHSAWTELCTGMAMAGSLDGVIEVHESYLSSIQRQCFVAPDKLWVLIASRIKTILGLAIDFYNAKQTLFSGGTTPAMRAGCDMEIIRIEKQFDDCVAFLLRILSLKLNVGHLPHLADLVTRINYNYFYTADSGNLLTVPRFDSSVKSLKPLDLNSRT